MFPDRHRLLRRKKCNEKQWQTKWTILSTGHNKLKEEIAAAVDTDQVTIIRKIDNFIQNA